MHLHAFTVAANLFKRDNKLCSVYASRSVSCYTILARTIIVPVLCRAEFNHADLPIESVLSIFPWQTMDYDPYRGLSCISINKFVKPENISTLR